MKNNSTPKCNHECDLINWDTGNYQCSNCGALIRKYDWLNDKMKKAAKAAAEVMDFDTPSEGLDIWKLIHDSEDYSDPQFYGIDEHKLYSNIEQALSQEIATAKDQERQEIIEALEGQLRLISPTSNNADYVKAIKFSIGIIRELGREE